MTFQYQALPPNHIRLLELSSKESESSRMRSCDIKTAAKWKYAALSYAWGSNTETVTFSCNEQNLPVRQNLHQALLRLRNVLREPIWIDAMCMNQEDNKEKVSQIQKMTDIYRSASSVIIWLGEDIPDVSIAISQMAKVTAMLKNMRSTAKQAEQMMSPSFVVGVRHLLTSPWWSRLWVLQEATLARDAKFMCGSHVVLWTALSALVKQIKRLDLFALFRGHNHRPEYCDGFTEILNTEIVRHTHSTTLQTDLIRICRQRMCSDPRDRVYAVIGLMGEYMLEGFTWDPNDSVEELYPPFIGVLLTLDHIAFPLSMTDTTQRNPNLPSWCPDLHHRSVCDVLADHEGYHAGFTIQTTTKLDWEQYRKDPRVLRMQGNAVDSVKLICDGQWVDDNIGSAADGSAHAIILGRNGELLRTWTTTVVRYVPARDLWRVFIGNIVSNNEDSKLHWLAGFSSFHDRLVNRRFKPAAESYKSAFDELASLLTGSLPSSVAVEAYLKAARRVCNGRRLFVTHAGRIGFGPRSTTAGDIVCIIKGAKVPFIMSKSPSQPGAYHLKGEAFVHGLMHGEHLKAAKSFGYITMV